MSSTFHFWVGSCCSNGIVQNIITLSDTTVQQVIIDCCHHNHPEEKLVKNYVSACIAVWSLSHWDTVWHRTKAGDMTPNHQLLPELCQWSHSSTHSEAPWGIKQWLPPVINQVSDGLLGSYCKLSSCFQETYCFDLLSCFVCLCKCVE